MNDPYNLQRFVDAQAPVFAQVSKELRAGGKQSHWMWFVFPQLKGLGHSPMASYFGITSRDEAMAFLEHPLLGTRLYDCTQLVLLTERQTIGDIFGYPDDLKFHSSMTLFAQVGVDNQLFLDALHKYFSGEPHRATLAQLKQHV
jgi:uncharacterized protein (DUF1810 family)